jgi:SAM-dependent methyltransferase
MHELAKQRLGADNNRVQYLLRDFKANGWSFGIDQVDIVVTNQTVHELRHKRYALDFLIQIRDLLKRDGVLLYSDHYSGDDGLGNEKLYMRRTEQWAILELAGYKVAEVLVKGGRALYRALPTYSNS